MKRRHNAPQLDLPTPGEDFALIGEVIRNEAPAALPAPKVDPRQQAFGFDDDDKREPTLGLQIHHSLREPMKAACACVHDCCRCPWRVLPGGGEVPECFVSRGFVGGELPPPPRPSKAILYNDGRPGHQGVRAVVLEETDAVLVVQFEDRAAPTTITKGDPKWAPFIRPA